MTCRTQTARRANETLDPDRHQLPRQAVPREPVFDPSSAGNEGRGMMLTKAQLLTLLWQNPAIDRVDTWNSESGSFQ